MASPAKRRKKNDFNSSPSSVRNLDFFFSKKSNDVGSKPVVEEKDMSTATTDSGPPFEAVPDQEQSDEAFARQLQAEWNEDGAQHASVTEDARVPIETSVERTTDAGPENGALKRTGDSVSPAAAPEARNGLLAQMKSKAKSISLQSGKAADDTVSASIPLDESPLTFQPSKYIDDLKSGWASEGGDASYALLTRCFILVNSTQSRIKIVDTLVNFLRLLIEADPESLLPAVWLATNSISPPYISLELGVGDSCIYTGLKFACELSNEALRALYKKHGDAGDVAFEAKKRPSLRLTTPQPLTINNVYRTLVKIANNKGKGCRESRQKLVDKLIQDCRGPEESRYIVRTLAQHLRIGAVKTTMLIALSRAFLLSRPREASFSIRPQTELIKLKKDRLAEVYAQNEEIVKACYARRPNYNDLVPALLEIGVTEALLSRCGMALHIPLQPMLGSITRDMAEMLTKLQGRSFSCEFKYDGQRAQVHCDEEGKVSIFSRHLELMTDKYPDLVALVPEIRGGGVKSFIMEGEVVAVDRETGRLKTFQTLAGRGRKDVAISKVTVNVCLFAFDLMYLNGEALLDRPFRQRRELLRSRFKEIPGHFTWVKSLDADSTKVETVSAFFKSATDNQCEGIMVKVLDNVPNPALANATDNANGSAETPNLELAAKEPPSKEKSTRRKALLASYEPDKRVDSWLKVKKDYDTTFDTLDLIPIAAWHGTGRKAKWWSPILLACRNPITGSLEAVCKCMSGFTDKFYVDNKEHYAPGSSNVLASRPAYVEYTTAIEPDVWFEPHEVWEIAFADVTISPVYTSAIGLVHEDKGLSLRFPRFLKVREDKGIEEASDSDFLAELYRKQEVKPPEGTGEVDDVDAEVIEEPKTGMGEPESEPVSIPGPGQSADAA